GSDGVLEVLSVDGDRAEVRIWNPDGSGAELSGNGARIVAAWLSRRAQAPRVVLRIGEREVEALVGDDHLVRLDVGRVEGVGGARGPLPARYPRPAHASVPSRCQNSAAEAVLAQGFVEADLEVGRIVSPADDQRAGEVVRPGGKPFRPRPRYNDCARRHEAA